MNQVCPPVIVFIQSFVHVQLPSTSCSSLPPFLLSLHQATCGSKLEDKAKEVKGQYATELGKLQKELKQLKAAKKEHQKALKQQASTDRELKALKKDLEDMKKQRVKLMHRMRDEATRNRQEVGIGCGWSVCGSKCGVCVQE